MHLLVPIRINISFLLCLENESAPSLQQRNSRNRTPETGKKCFREKLTEPNPRTRSCLTVRKNQSILRHGFPVLQSPSTARTSPRHSTEMQVKKKYIAWIRDTKLYTTSKLRLTISPPQILRDSLIRLTHHPTSLQSRYTTERAIYCFSEFVHSDRELLFIFRTYYSSQSQATERNQWCKAVVIQSLLSATQFCHYTDFHWCSIS